MTWFQAFHSINYLVDFNSKLRWKRWSCYANREHYQICLTFGNCNYSVPLEKCYSSHFNTFSGMIIPMLRGILNCTMWYPVLSRISRIVPIENQCFRFRLVAQGIPLLFRIMKNMKNFADGIGKNGINTKNVSLVVHCERIAKSQRPISYRSA